MGSPGDSTQSSAQTTPPRQTKQPVLQSPFRASLQKFRNRRSRSAPPAPRTPMMEQHYCVDSKRKEVLPGIPIHEDDWARDSHDFFNLIVLIPIVALNVMNWNWEKMMNLKKKETMADAWTGEWFDIFFMCTISYFLADLLWVLIIPKCVKSPTTIVQHHVVTMLYIFIPYFRPDLRWCMGACMSVEVNTWFLIARRVFNKQGFPPWIIDLSFVSIRVKLISIGFYITWIGIRCILYPIMMVYLVQRWWKVSQESGNYFNIELVNPVMHSSFCILNFKWTYDLLMSKIRYYKRRASHMKEYEVSKGL
jgi:hypothetical protein